MIKPGDKAYCLNSLHNNQVEVVEFEVSSVQATHTKLETEVEKVYTYSDSDYEIPVYTYFNTKREALEHAAKYFIDCIQAKKTDLETYTNNLKIIEEKLEELNGETK